MSEYKLKRVFRQSVGCPLAKYMLCLLAYCPEFSIYSLTSDSELSTSQVEDALQYLVDEKLIKFRNGTFEGKDGTQYQIEILF